MSVKIWCDECEGLRLVSTDYGSKPCPHCFGSGYIEKGCENCKYQELECLEAIERDREGYRAVTFCTAWEKKDEN